MAHCWTERCSQAARGAGYVARNPAPGCNLAGNGAPTTREFALFRVLAGGILHLHDLTLANGCTSGNGSYGNGGAIYSEA